MLSGQKQPGTAARISLRQLQMTDADEFIALMRKSRFFHHPWIHPPVNKAEFRLYLERFKQPNHKNYALCKKKTGAIAGVINLNHITKGCLLSASLGYYTSVHFAGLGYMREGMQLVIEDAFKSMKLHSLEANIQPGNQASIKLVRSLGFRYVGLMPEFLFVDDAWRDHEKWVLVDQRSGLLK